MFRVCHVILSVQWCLVATCWERADLLALVCDVLLCFCYFPMTYPGSDVVLDCIDSWSLVPFHTLWLATVCGIGSLKPQCELNIFVLYQQQNLEWTFGTSKMHLTPPPRLAKAAVRSKAVVLLLLISTPIAVIVLCFCALLYSLTYLLPYWRQTSDLSNSASKTPTV